MGTVGYYLFYCFNWLVTLLPLKILYIVSDLIYPLMYYVLKYRRTVVRTNLINSFPGKSPGEIIAIEKKFYHHLCDMFIETFKLTHMNSKQLMKRIKFINCELLDRLYKEGRDVIAVMGHFGNWEWLSCLPFFTDYKTVSIYKPLQNKHFDHYINENRSKFGMVLTPMKFVVREIVENRKKNIRSLYAFITDQTPAREEIHYWTTFMNQETPVFLGAEKISSKYDMAMVFFRFLRVRRGEYTVTVDLLFEHTAGLPEHLITETHVKKLEEVIRQSPQYWVWSHRRWKYKREHTNG